MKLLGSPSWQLTEDDGDRAHVLLYIRDVAGLEVPPEVDAPPRLVGLPPHGIPMLHDDDLCRRAGREWAGWWLALLEAEARDGPGEHRLCRFAGELRGGLLSHELERQEHPGCALAGVDRQ